MTSELENEGVRTILKRLDRLEPIVARLEETVKYLSDNGGCWSYIMDGNRVDGGHVLAGQDFANTVTEIRKDLATLRQQAGIGRLDPPRALSSPNIGDAPKARSSVKESTP